MKRLLPLLFMAACSEGTPEPVVVPPVAAPMHAEVVVARRAELGPGLESPPEPGTPDAVTREQVEAVLGALASGEADFRALAIEDARALSPAGVAELVRVLRDPEAGAEVRAGVAEVLGKLATAHALDALVTAIEQAEEPWLRAQCGYWLGQSGRDVVLPRLALRLKYEKDHATSFWMADALARFGHLAGIEGMLNVWRGTEDETLRAQSASRLGELAAERGCADAGELLQRWKAGELAPPATPFSPSRELEAEAWRWIASLGAWNLRNVDDARFVLVRLEEWIVPLLVEALEERDVYVRLHALQVLERRGPRARGAFAEVVRTLAEARLAPAAAQTLGALGETAAAGALESALSSPDPELAVAAATALGRLGSTASVPALKASFESARGLDLREACALARLELGDDTARPFVLACLTDPLADAGAAEAALDRWLVRAAARDEALTSVLEPWRALETDPATIPTAAQLDARRAARARLLAGMAR